MTEDIINTDVLVVGGGGAAFRAAIGAREKGVKALLVSKGPLARCGATPMAGADFTLDGLSLSKLGFDGEPKDSPEIFGKISERIRLYTYTCNNSCRLFKGKDWPWRLSYPRPVY